MSFFHLAALARYSGYSAAQLEDLLSQLAHREVIARLLHAHTRLTLYTNGEQEERDG